MTASNLISPPKSARLAPPTMRFARFEDYPQIARLEEANNLQVRNESDWRGLWLDNPLWPQVKHTWPIGWVFESAAGEIVGSIVSIPSLYTMGGRELLCANGRSWVCAPEYRAFAIMLMDEYLNYEGADLFINTTVGPFSVQSQDKLASRVPLGDWQTTSYWVTNYRGFARAILKKKKFPLPGLFAIPAAAALAARDTLRRKSLPDIPPDVTIETVREFDPRFDDFWRQLADRNPRKLLACRDRAALAWHYAFPLRQNRLRILTASRGGALRGYCVLKRHDQQSGIHRMRLVDYQSIDPQGNLLPALLKAAQRLCAEDDIDMLDHVGLGLPKMRELDKCAPYRHTLANWIFYYRSNDPQLSAQLSHPEIWDPSSYDGDASFE
jgi:hypothetical protein